MEAQQRVDQCLFAGTVRAEQSDGALFEDAAHQCASSGRIPAQRSSAARFEAVAE
jgi:hypothetical protein